MIRKLFIAGIACGLMHDSLALAQDTDPYASSQANYNAELDDMKIKEVAEEVKLLHYAAKCNVFEPAYLHEVQIELLDHTMHEIADGMDERYARNQAKLDDAVNQAEREGFVQGLQGCQYFHDNPDVVQEVRDRVEFIHKFVR